MSFEVELTFEFVNNSFSTGYIIFLLFWLYANCFCTILSIWFATQKVLLFAHLKVKDACGR